jgi:hypothetical protein
MSVPGTFRTCRPIWIILEILARKDAAKYNFAAFERFLKKYDAGEVSYYADDVIDHRAHPMRQLRSEMIVCHCSGFFAELRIIHL